MKINNEGKLIQNDYVSGEWWADSFYESKKSGFVAAVINYEGEKGNVSVCFKDQKAFILIDENSKPEPESELRKAIKESAKEGYPIDELYEDVYVELADSSEANVGVLEYYGLGVEEAKDIEERLQDLSCYWVTIEEDM